MIIVRMSRYYSRQLKDCDGMESRSVQLHFFERESPTISVGV